MTHDDILKSVYLKVSNTAGLPTIFYPNVNYTTTPDNYVRVTVIPAPTFDATIDDGLYQYGVIQIDCVTRDGIGEIKAAEYSQIVMSAFKRGTIISGGLKVNRPPYASAGLVGSGKYSIPVTIPYSNYDYA